MDEYGCACARMWEQQGSMRQSIERGARKQEGGVLDLGNVKALLNRHVAKATCLTAIPKDHEIEDNIHQYHGEMFANSQ